MNSLTSRVLQQIRTPQARLWWLVWTGVGVVFAIQLRWHYDAPWSLSFFWGLSDWYLWGVLGVGIVAGIRYLRDRISKRWSRCLIYLAAAPVIISMHVALTILVGGLLDTGVFANLTESFHSLYAKKLTLNAGTLGTLTLFGEWAPMRRSPADIRITARLGERTRAIRPGQIIWAEAAGNYVNLHTTQGVWPTRNTMMGLSQRLPPDSFLRISRSILVNTVYLEGTERHDSAMSLRMTDGTVVNVARRYRAAVRRSLQGRFDPNRSHR